MSAALLIGYGSVGSKHANILGSRFSRVDVVDRRTSLGVTARSTGLNFFETVSDLKKNSGYDLVVIATWADSHLPLVREILERLTLRAILIEKPLADSVSAANKILELCHAENIKVACNFTRSFGMFVPQLRSYFTEQRLKVMRIRWGQRNSCLCTVGIHWFNLAENFFESDCSDLSGRCYYEGYNPRSDALRELRGELYFSFPTGQSLELSTSFDTDGVIFETESGQNFSMKKNQLYSLGNGETALVLSLDWSFEKGVLDAYRSVQYSKEIESKNIYSTQAYFHLILSGLDNPQVKKAMLDNDVEWLDQYVFPVT